MVGIRLKLTLDQNTVMFNAGALGGPERWVSVSREQAIAILERHLFGARYDPYLTLEGGD